MDLPRWWAMFRLRLRSLFRRAQVEQELDEEIREHLALQADRNAVQGMEHRLAQAAARRAFGGIEGVKDDVRDVRAVEWVERLGRDLRHAVRLTVRRPLFPLIVGVSLAVGIGVATTVFGLTWNVLFAPLPVPHPDRLVQLERVDRLGTNLQFSWSAFQAMQGTAGVSGVSVLRTFDNQPLASGSSGVQFGPVDVVDGNYFSTLGLAPAAGRLITDADEAGGFPVAVITPGLARTLYPNDASVLGRTVTIRGTPFTIIGVVPPTFHGLVYPGWPSVTIPIRAASLAGLAVAQRPSEPEFDMFARLGDQPGAGRAALSAKFSQCCAAIHNGVAEHLELPGMRSGIAGGKSDLRGSLRPMLFMLLAGVGLVLAVVCSNIAGLFLLRMSGRQREIAVRLSLGASRARLAGQLICEAVPMAVVGGAGGFVVARLLTAWFGGVIPPGLSNYTPLVQAPIDPAVIGFGLLVTLLCTAVFSLYPAWRASALAAASTLRGSVGNTGSRRQGRVARGVVMIQVAVSIVLTLSAGLLAATVRNMSRIDGGFSTDRILVAAVETRGTPFERDGVVPVIADLGARIAALPGVQGFGMATLVPMFGGRLAGGSLEVPGYSPAQGEQPQVVRDAITPGFLRAAGIEVLEGRDFAAADRAGSEPVAILSANVARQYFGAASPVGRTIGIRIDSITTSLRIIGVARDTRFLDLRQPPDPIVYVPMSQSGPWPFAELAVHTTTEPLALGPALRQAVDAAAPGIRVRRISEMRAERDASMSPQRLAGFLAGFVALVSLILTVVGLYGVVAYGVSRRTAEIGIRMALGSSARGILWMVLREAVEFTGIGVMLGLPLAWLAGQAIRSQLFGIGATNPLALGLTVGALVVAAIVAAVLPARRAAHVDPRQALAAE